MVQNKYLARGKHLANKSLLRKILLLRLQCPDTYEYSAKRIWAFVDNTTRRWVKSGVVSFPDGNYARDPTISALAYTWIQPSWGGDERRGTSLEEEVPDSERLDLVRQTIQSGRKVCTSRFQILVILTSADVNHHRRHGRGVFLDPRIQTHLTSDIGNI